MSQLLTQKLKTQQGRMRGMNTDSEEAMQFLPHSLGRLCSEPSDAT